MMCVLAHVLQVQDLCQGENNVTIHVQDINADVCDATPLEGKEKLMQVTCERQETGLDKKTERCATTYLK